MKDTNSEIEEQLDSLAEICCQTLNGDPSDFADRTDALLKSLMMSGYVRKAGPNITSELESRVKQRCPEPSIHRGGELSGISKVMQRKFDKLVQWESRQPKENTPPKAANISSATDA